jgi:hypothetical protein
MRSDVALENRVEPVELTRLRYRPERITTLFVGESAPAGGTFFYYGDSGLRRYMEAAVLGTNFRVTGDFLEWFKSRGWYLDDLVLTPVNQLTRAHRRAAWSGAKDCLAERIIAYRPRAIVSLLLGIRHVVKAAAEIADYDGPMFAVPFAGNGQQARFRAEMTRILPKLPTIAA